MLDGWLSVLRLQECGNRFIKGAGESGYSMLNEKCKLTYNQKWKDVVKEGKTFQITQIEVLSAYKAVKTNKVAVGVDKVNFEMLEKNWENDYIYFGT